MLQLEKRLLALGVPKSVSKDTVSEVTKWLSKSGPEWTVSRLKLMKQELLNRLSENDFRVPWIARNSSGLPKGPFSWFFRMALSGDDKKISLAINSLMIYSYFISDHMTKIQEEKFFSSMESTDTKGLSAEPKVVPKIPFRTVNASMRIPFLGEVALSPNRFQAGIDGKSYPETDLGRQFEFFNESEVCRWLVFQHPRLFSQVIPEVLTGLPKKYSASSGDIPMEVYTSVGKISFIQEPGFKLRAVANPSRVIQAGLEPLKVFARELLKHEVNDCTFDQESGVSRVQQWLREGRTCHSIDLSDATNMFPRHYQISLLTKMVNQLSDKEEKLVLHDALELFSDCCRMPWFSKQNDGSFKLHWFKRGQPLGLGPSFFIFGYTHNIVLRGICIKHNIPQDSYVVLGDDVCISNEELASRYKATLNNLGCKISNAKSITSNKFAEFAGVVITPGKEIHQYKWRDFTDSNFIDVCRQIGPKSVELLTRSQRAVIDAIAEIPSEIGGMGWNPLGKSLSERLSSPIAQMLLDSKDETLLLFESVVNKTNAFYRDPIIREYVRRWVSPGDTVSPMRRTSSAQEEWKVMHPHNNVMWLARCELAIKTVEKGNPLPQFRLGRTAPMEYVSAVPLQGDPRKDKFNCTKSILQRKLRNVDLYGS